MIATIEHQQQQYRIDLAEPIDISLPLTARPEATSAWYVEPMQSEPVRMDGFVGSVAEGGPVNFRNLRFNPHGNGTHTECVGHISREHESVNDSLKRHFWLAQLVTVTPEPQGEDHVITQAALQQALGDARPEAIVIRTLPNDEGKRSRQYSNTNFPYVHHEAMRWLVELGIEHFLIDLPSVDREDDNGALLAHRAFWNYPEATSTTRTITELVYIPNHVADGAFILNLAVAPFENDASPSRPTLYKIFIG